MQIYTRLKYKNQPTVYKNNGIIKSQHYHKTDINPTKNYKLQYFCTSVLFQQAHPQSFQEL